MQSYNKIILIGRLSCDVLTKEVGQGYSLATTTLVMNRVAIVKGEKREETCFIDIEAWGKNAEFLSNYFSKGSAILIEGRLKQDKWVDKDSGKNRSVHKILVERIQFCEQKEEGSQQPRKSQASQKKVDSIPF